MYIKLKWNIHRWKLTHITCNTSVASGLSLSRCGYWKRQVPEPISEKGEIGQFSNLDTSRETSYLAKIKVLICTGNLVNVNILEPEIKIFKVIDMITCDSWVVMRWSSLLVIQIVWCRCAMFVHLVIYQAINVCYLTNSDN